MFVQYLITSFTSIVFIMGAIGLSGKAKQDWSFGWPVRILISIAYLLMCVGIILPWVLVIYL